jgi:hypothetical protein
MVGGFSSQLPPSTRQHPHLVAGAAHEGRLDLIMRQHVAAERRPAGQNRQLAVFEEGRMRTSALWPQNGPQSPTHQAWPMV